MEFATEWRKLYQPSMDEVRCGRRAWTILDELHRESLLKLIGRYGIKNLSAEDVDDLNRACTGSIPGRTWSRASPGSSRS